MGKEWVKLEKLRAWQMTNVKSKSVVFLEAQKEQRTVHFATQMGHLKHAESIKKYKSQVVLRGDIVKYD